MSAATKRSPASLPSLQGVDAKELLLPRDTLRSHAARQTGRRWLVGASAHVRDLRTSAAVATRPASTQRRTSGRRRIRSSVRPFPVRIGRGATPTRSRSSSADALAAASLRGVEKTPATRCTCRLRVDRVFQEPVEPPKGRLRRPDRRVRGRATCRPRSPHAGRREARSTASGT